MIELPLPRESKLNEPYWEASRRGELAIQRCTHCTHPFLYPRLWCPKCWAPEPKWECASGKGVVIACTVVYQAPYESYAALVPYVLAIVRLSEGPQLMANVVDCDPTAVTVGMAVTVRFEQRGDVSVPQFAPEQG